MLSLGPRSRTARWGWTSDPRRSPPTAGSYAPRELSFGMGRWGSSKKRPLLPARWALPVPWQTPARSRSSAVEIQRRPWPRLVSQTGSRMFLPEGVPVWNFLPGAPFPASPPSPKGSDPENLVFAKTRYTRSLGRQKLNFQGQTPFFPSSHGFWSLNMRMPVIAGNWKMHKTTEEARALARAIKVGAGNVSHCQVVLAPPYTVLSAVAAEIRGSALMLAGQNVHWQGNGAFTGEVSVPMLEDVGCHMVILGHSERRQLFSETDETVNRRVHAVAKSSLQPIV